MAAIKGGVLPVWARRRSLRLRRGRLARTGSPSIHERTHRLDYQEDIWKLSDGTDFSARSLYMLFYCDVDFVRLISGNLLHVAPRSRFCKLA